MNFYDCKCGQKLRLPKKKRISSFSCPKCNTIYKVSDNNRNKIDVEYSIKDREDKPSEIFNPDRPYEDPEVDRKFKESSTYQIGKPIIVWGFWFLILLGILKTCGDATERIECSKNLRDRGYSEHVALERCAILQNLKKCGREYCSKVND